MKFFSFMLCMGFGFCHAMNYNADDIKRLETSTELIAEALQGINIKPIHAYYNCLNKVFVFAEVPESFFKFVKTKEEVPLTTIERFFGYLPKPHCDFSNKYKWMHKENGFLDECISSSHSGFSAPDMAIKLVAYKEDKKRNILIGPRSAVFVFHIIRTELECVKLGVEYVEEIKDGVYVVAPDDIKQLDCTINSDILKKLKDNGIVYEKTWK